MPSVSAKLTTIEAVETLIQYKFNHTALLWEALQCPSSPYAKHPNGNKRLAIIGNTVLQLSLAEDWFLSDETIGTRRSGTLSVRAYNDYSQVKLYRTLTQSILNSGDFDHLRQSVASNANLQRVGLELGLERFMGRREDALPAGLRTMADTVAAILGAVYLDSGVVQVKDVVGALGLVLEERRVEPEVIVIDD